MEKCVKTKKPQWCISHRGIIKTKQIKLDTWDRDAHDQASNMSFFIVLLPENIVNITYSLLSKKPLLILGFQLPMFEKEQKVCA